MSQDDLVSLFHASSFILLTNLPSTVSIQLSLDSYAWTVRSPSASQVLGIKLIPPHGLHTLSLGIQDAPLTFSFFWLSEQPSLLVLRYEPDVEDWHVVADGAQEWSGRLQGLDPLLIPYPRVEVTGSQATRSDSKKWHGLTSWVTDKVLRATLPKVGKGLCGPDWTSSFIVYKVNSQTSSHYSTSDKCDSSSPSSSTLPPSSSTLPPSGPTVSSITATMDQDWIHFPVYRLGPSRSAILSLTTQALDKSHVLDKIVSETAGSEAYILGEWQLAFLLLLKCSNMEGLDHWKAIFELFTHCRMALQQRWTLFIDWMVVLKTQLLEMSKTDADMLLGESNFIASYLNELFCTMDEQAEECGSDLSSLLAESKNLQAVLQAHFEWPLSRTRIERDDEQPVIVDLE